MGTAERPVKGRARLLLGKDSVILEVNRAEVRQASRYGWVWGAAFMTAAGMGLLALEAATGDLAWLSVRRFLALLAGTAAFGAFVGWQMRWPECRAQVTFKRGRVIVSRWGGFKGIVIAPTPPLRLEKSESGKDWVLSSPSSPTSRAKLPVTGFADLDLLVEAYNDRGVDGIHRLIDEMTAGN